MYRVQHYERMRTTKVQAHLNQNLNDVILLRNYILFTINMSEKPKIGIKKNIELYIGTFGLTKLLR